MSYSQLVSSGLSFLARFSPVSNQSFAPRLTSTFSPALSSGRFLSACSLRDSGGDNSFPPIGNITVASRRVKRGAVSAEGGAGGSRAPRPAQQGGGEKRGPRGAGLQGGESREVRGAETLPEGSQGSRNERGRDGRDAQGGAQGWVGIGGSKAEALRVRVGWRWAEDEGNAEAEAEAEGALGETPLQKRRRFGQAVEKMKGDAARRRKLAEKGLPPHPLGAPGNGLLVPRLVPVAHRTLALWLSLQAKIPRLLDAVPAHACRWCPEVSIAHHPHVIRNCKGPKLHSCSGSPGSHEWAPATPSDILPVIESFHLPDRLRPRVPHEARFDVERIPAVIELCVQAGVDLPGLRTVRRTEPVQTTRPGTGRAWVAGLEGESESGVFKRGAYKGGEGDVVKAILEMAEMEAMGAEVAWDEGSRGTMRRGEGGWRVLVEEGGGGKMERWLESRCNTEVDRKEKGKGEEKEEKEEEEGGEDGDEAAEGQGSLREVAEEALREWQAVREGVERVMGKYPVMVCGYCPEVHVGAAGHKVRLCNASKQQWRHGQHGWQPAVLADLLPPVPVYHTRHPSGPPLLHELRAFYGRVPALVELCVQAGAPVPDKWRRHLRLDVAIPDVSDVDNVV
ncbi:unnamed protein product [Closterium sp. NIES-65]|nr:unnamed protein product [Closterium sp. NIES-65]